MFNVYVKDSKGEARGRSLFDGNFSDCEKFLEENFPKDVIKTFFIIKPNSCRPETVGTCFLR